MLLALTLAACSSAAGDDFPSASPTAPAAVDLPAAATLPPPETAAVEPDSGPTPPATEPTDSTAALPLPHYTLTATLSYSQHLLQVDERIRYTNRSPDSLPDLRLMVDPLYYPGVFRLVSIAWEGGQPVEDYTIESGQIQVPLADPLTPGERLDLSISYELHLPSPVPSEQVRPIPFGYTARQTNLVDWYPFVPPYQPGQGWLAHQAGFFGEHLVYDLADFDVSLRFSDPSPELVVAASAPAEQDGDWRRYRHTAARNFVWSASHEYQVFTSVVGDTTVMSYAFSFHTTASEAVLQTTAETLTLLDELYTPYPRRLLSVVEADFLDGMEYDGLYFLSNGFYNLYQGSPGEYLIAIAAHETAHQWFYALVGNDQALEPWLDEALCTYQERIFYERLHPQSLDWWWAYRVNYYDPRGWVNRSIYISQGYRAYRDAVYLNGAVFLEELRNQIGDQAFFDFLRDYVLQNQGLIATGERLFEILGQHTQEDLSPLLSRFFSP